MPKGSGLTVQDRFLPAGVLEGEAASCPSPSNQLGPSTPGIGSGNYKAQTPAYLSPREGRRPCPQTRYAHWSQGPITSCRCWSLAPADATEESKSPTAQRQGSIREPHPASVTVSLLDAGKRVPFPGNTHVRAFISVTWDLAAPGVLGEPPAPVRKSVF